MSFSYSAGVLTQSGTDTDLSGLTGLTGVTKTTGNFLTIYSIDSSTIVVSGTLTITVGTELLVFQSTCPATELSITGTLNINGKVTGAGGDPWYIYDTVIQFNRNSSSSYLTSDACLQIENTGTYDAKGGTVVGDPVIAFGGDTVGNGEIIIENHVIRGLNQNQGQFIGNFTFNGFFESSGYRSTIKKPNLVLTNYAPKNSLSGLGCIDLANGVSPLTLNNFIPENNVKDIGLRYFGKIDVFNSNNGMMLKVGTAFSGTNSQNGGCCRIFKGVNFLVKDLSNTVIEGVKIYATPYYDGNQLNHSSTFTSQNGFDYDFTTLDILQLTTDVNGETNTQDILLKAISNITTTSTNEVIMRFTKNADDTATYEFFLCFYSKLLMTLTQGLNGIDDLTIKAIMLPDLIITETDKATVDAYLKLGTPQKLYDRAKSYLYDNFAGETETIVSRNGETIDAGDYDIVIDKTAISAFSISGNTITINANDYIGNITTTGTITLETGARIIGTAIDSTGTKKTLEFSITNLIANSRVQLYNVTTDTEIYNDIVTGTSLTGAYTEGVEYTSGDTVRLRVSNVINLTCYINEQVNAIVSSSGFSIKVYPAICPVYTDNGINGSTVTEYSSDYPNVQVDIDDPDGVTTVQRLFAWYRTNEYTEDGIRNFFNGLTAEDSVNYKIQTSIVDLMLDNVGDPVLINGARLYRDDNTTVIASGSIQMDPSKAYLASSDLIQTDLTTIKAKTDLLNFTGTDVQSIASNMRGTDGANTISPDNDSIADILADTNELQTNQSNWVTATGFSTPTNITDAQTAIQGSISALNDFDPSSDIVANVTLVDTVTTNTDMRGTDGANTIEPDNAGITSNGNAIASLNNFDPTTDEVITNTASREASKADVSLLATSAQINALNDFDPSSDIVSHVSLVDTVTTNTDMRGTDDALLAVDYTAPDNTEIIADLNIINVGVQKASKLIPHSTDL